ncbi:hypothetical protein BDR22DRAFT_886835 [Usnea florida]
MGNNSRIFEAHTAVTRYALGPQHNFEILDGAIPVKDESNAGFERRRTVDYLKSLGELEDSKVPWRANEKRVQQHADSNPDLHEPPRGHRLQ